MWVIALIIGIVIGFLIGLGCWSFVDADRDGGDLVIYPGENGAPYAVASFRESAVDKLEHDQDFKFILLHVVRLDKDSREKMSSYNEESDRPQLV